MTGTPEDLDGIGTLPHGLHGGDVQLASEWGPWIDWAGGECPIPDAKAGEYQLRFSHSTRIDDNPIGLPKQYAWKMNAAGCVITAYRVRTPADDLLRQAIEVLTNSCDLLENYIDTFGDMSGSNRADLDDYRAVLTAYDKREQS